MGREIEQIAVSRGHEVIHRFDADNVPQTETLRQADVAIEFTGPEHAVSNLEMCLNAGIPVVCGTTGWYAQYDQVRNNCLEKNGALFTATNFSIGVNILFYLNRRLSTIMQSYPEYACGIEEIHHTRKLDAPSGTAISLAEGIIESNSHFSKWSLSDDFKLANAAELPVHAKRIDDVPGTHTISWNSDIDRIDITHTAHNRKGFAGGAVIAAEWIIGKKGVFKMTDMLNFDNL